LRLCFALGTLVALAACTPHFRGAVQVNGAPFSPAGCRSGQAFGFSGVEISDAGGRRLRLLANADGTADVALFDPNALTGRAFGSCSTLTMRAQHSRINGIHNLEGTATFSCQGPGHEASGQLNFENCH
jgi:hypothetical protein